MQFHENRGSITPAIASVRIGGFDISAATIRGRRMILADFARKFNGQLFVSDLNSGNMFNIEII